MFPNGLYSLEINSGPPDSILTLTPGPCSLAMVHAALPWSMRRLAASPCSMQCHCAPRDSNMVQVATGCHHARDSYPT